MKREPEIRIKGAITHEILCIQDACEREFKDYVEGLGHGPYRLCKYCDGELYANFGLDCHVSFRDFLKAKIQK